MSDGAHDLLVRGIGAAKSGERAEARNCLEWALRQEPSAEQALEAKIWLSEAAEDPQEARRWLEDILAGDPTNPRARRRLALLDGRLRSEDVVDPDRPPPVPSEDSDIESKRFVCPACGGPMAYAPDGEDLQCDHCGRRGAVGSSLGHAGSPENDFVLALATARGHVRPKASRTFDCTACGARFLLAAATLSLTCPYCDATYTVEAGDERLLIAPEMLAPMAVAEPDVRRRLIAWAGGDHAPLVIDRLTAVYLPVWLFEMGGVVDWSTAPSGNHSWAAQAEPPSGTEPPWTPIAVLASSHLTQGQTAAAEESDPAHLVPFDSAFLAAWPAETYSLSLSDAALRARQRSLKATGDRLAAAAGGRRPSLRSARMVVDSYRLILVPVWLAAVRLAETEISVAVSGTTGIAHAGRRRPGAESA
jgi:DNA-directed RNA polymerase subunit RPC12/RpoP